MVLNDSSVSTPQITGLPQKIYKNQEKDQNFLFDSQSLVWKGLVFQGLSNHNNIHPPKFEKSDAVSTGHKNTLVHRLILVVCDTNRHDSPPIICKILISNECYRIYTKNIRPLKLNTTISKYIAFINRDKLYDNPSVKENTSVVIQDDAVESDSDNTQLTSSLCLKKLVLRLGDAIIVDNYSDCGYSVIYPNQLMEKEDPTCAISPKCSVGTQHGEGLESLDEYKVAFDFAKNHGYGFVEFVDVTHVSRSKKKKKRNRVKTIGDCMYATSHHLQKETFSIKYQSKSNSTLNQKGGRFCSATSAKKNNEPSDFDIVEKIKDTLVKMEIDSGEKTDSNKGHTSSNSKKWKCAENPYRKRINERYGRPEISSGSTDVHTVETNELCEERSEESNPRDNHDNDKEDDQSTTCDVTFNTWNEYDTPKSSYVQNNNNDSIDLQKKDKYIKDEDDINDIQKIEDETEVDGNERDENSVRMSKGRQNTFWERIRRHNPFKSMSCTLRIFKKCHSPCTMPKQPRSLKVEKVKIKRVEYNVTESGKENDVQNVPNLSDGEEKETAFSLNSGLIKFRPLEETDKRISNTSRCRPKPKTLRNSNVRRLFQMCGGERRFFSSTNLTKDEKELDRTISHEKYRDDTSGDFTQRLSKVDPNKSQLPTPTKTANAHGDVVLSSAGSKDIALKSHSLGDQKLPCGFGQIGNTFEGKKAQETNAILTEMENHPGKNNNKSETTVDFFHKEPNSKSISSLRKEDSVETLTEPDSSLSEDANFDNRTEVTDDNNKDMDLQESNFNNNADDKENENEPNDSNPQNSLNTNVDTFQDIQNVNPMVPSRSVFLIDSDNSEHKLDDALTCLVKEQDNKAEDNLAYASYSLGPLSTDENDPYFNQNSSKIIQRDHGRPSGRHCGPPTDTSNRSYVLSSPGRPETRESDTIDHEENDTVHNLNIGDQGRSPVDENRQDGMECCETGCPPLNMHQRNMVYCPTTENYWAPTSSYPRLTNVGIVRNDSRHNPNSLRMFSDPNMHMEDECEAEDSIDFYRLIDSCIAETENKLTQRLQNMYGTVNERLSSLEALVKRKFDKTLSLIENLKKQNMNRSMNKIDRENERASEAIHLNTEATRSSIPEIFSVKNLGNLIQNDDVSPDGTTNMRKTFPTIAFSEVTPNINHLQSSENADDNEGTSVLEIPASESEKSKIKHYTQEQNSEKHQIKNKERKHTKCKKQLVKNKKKDKSKQKYSKNKQNKLRSLKKSKKAKQIQLLSGNTIFPKQYLRRQHSRKCRLRQHMTGESSCNFCMGTPKKHGANAYKGKDNNAQKTVHWLSDDTVKEGNRREYRRSPHPRVVRMFQNTKKRNRVADIEKQVSQRKQSGGTSKRRQKRDESKRKKRNAKKVVSWSDVVFKNDRTGKKYRRSPHSNVVKRLQRIDRIKKETKCVSSGRKSKRKKCEKTIGKTREYFDKSNCSIKNIFGKSTDENGEMVSDYDSHGCAYRQLLKKNQRLVKEVEIMKQYSSRGRNDIFTMKRKVMGKFNRLLSTCSPQRAHALYCILFPREEKHSPSNPSSHILLTNNSKSSVHDEKNNNKSLGATDRETFNKTKGDHSQNVRLDNGLLVKNDLLQHVDSFNLIPKGSGWTYKIKNSCQIYDSSRPPLTPCSSIKDEQATSNAPKMPHCSYTDASHNAHVLPKFCLKQHHEKQTENSHKAMSFDTKHLCKSDLSGNGTWKTGLVNLNPCINNITNGSSRDVETNANEATVKNPDNSNISTKSYVSRDLGHRNTGLFQFIYHGNIYIDHKPIYSWSKPIRVDLSDFTEQLNHDMFRRESNIEIDELTVSGSRVNNNNVERIQMLQPAQRQNDTSVRPCDSRKESMNENRKQPNSELSKMNSKNEIDNDKSSSHSMADHNVPKYNASNGSSCCRNIPTLVLRLTPKNSSNASEGQLGSQVADNIQPIAPIQKADHSNLDSPTGNDDRSALSVSMDIQSEIGKSSEHYVDSQKRGNFRDNCVDFNISDSNRSIPAAGKIPSSFAAMNDVISTQKPNQTDHPKCIESTECNSNKTFDDMAGFHGDESTMRISQSSELGSHQGSSLVIKYDDVLVTRENLHDQLGYLASFDVNKTQDLAEPVENEHNDKTTCSNGFEMSNKSEHNGTIGRGELLKTNEQSRHEDTKCSCLNICSASNHNAISINLNGMPKESSRLALPMTSTDDSCSPHNSRHLLSALKSRPTNKTLYSLKPNNSFGTVDLSADDEMSKRKCTTKQPYLEVRTPGLSTRWIMSTRPSTGHSSHQSDIHIPIIDAQENSCIKTETTKTNRECVSSGENSIDGADDNNCTERANLISQCERRSGQMEMDCPECSSNNPEKLSFTWSETNNNNVTDNLIVFPSDYQKDGTFILHANDKRQESFTNCQSFSDKQNCQCGCPRVKSLTTLPFQKQKFLQNICLLGPPEGGEGCSQEIQITTRNGVTWRDRGEGPALFSNPRKRHMINNVEEEKYAHAAKRCRKEGHRSSIRRSKIKFRRIRWQLLREIRKLSDGPKNQQETNKHTFAPVDQVDPPSSDADSESSL